MADTNRTRLAYWEESTWGVLTTPASFQNIRFTGESLTFNVANTQSAEIRSDRMITDLVQTGADPGGGFNFELSYGTFDDIIAGAMWADWSTPDAAARIMNGTTEHSFILERYHSDVTQYFYFKGMVVNTFTLTATADSIVTGSFDFIGKSATRYASSSAAENYSATTVDVMNAVANVSDIKLDGVGISPFIQEISFTLTNNVRGIKAIGTLGNADIGVGSVDLTGSFNMYFSSATWYDKFLAADPVSLEFTIQDSSSQGYTFYFPKIKFESNALNAGGQNADVMQNLGWRAIRASDTTPYMIRIYRNT